MPEQIPQNTEEPLTLETEKSEPDIKELGHLFFLSFKFSQGNAGAQKEIFEYLKTKHPGWVLTDEFLDKLESELVPRFSRYMERGLGLTHAEETSSGQTVLDESKNSVAQTVRNEIEELSSVWESADAIDKGEIMKSLLGNILNSDHFWLSRLNGRNKQMGERYHPDRDPFLSHLVYYGFLGHDTGSKDYNDMFLDMAEFLREKYNKHGITYFSPGKLVEVINIWNEKHPSMQFNLESLSE